MIVTSNSPWWPLAVASQLAGDRKQTIPVPYQCFLQWHCDYLLVARAEQSSDDALKAVHSSYS